MFAGNGLKCEYVRETAKSAIPHRRTLSLPLLADREMKNCHLSEHTFPRLPPGSVLTDPHIKDIFTP